MLRGSFKRVIVNTSSRLVEIVVPSSKYQGTVHTSGRLLINNAVTVGRWISFHSFVSLRRCCSFACIGIAFIDRRFHPVSANQFVIWKARNGHTHTKKNRFSTAYLYGKPADSLFLAIQKNNLMIKLLICSFQNETKI